MIFYKEINPKIMLPEVSGVYLTDLGILRWYQKEKVFREGDKIIYPHFWCKECSQLDLAEGVSETLKKDSPMTSILITAEEAILNRVQAKLSFTREP